MCCRCCCFFLPSHNSVFRCCVYLIVPGTFIVRTPSHVATRVPFQQYLYRSQQQQQKTLTFYYEFLYLRNNSHRTFSFLLAASFWFTHLLFVLLAITKNNLKSKLSQTLLKFFFFCLFPHDAFLFSPLDTTKQKNNKKQTKEFQAIYASDQRSTSTFRASPEDNKPNNNNHHQCRQEPARCKFSRRTANGSHCNRRRARFRFFIWFARRFKQEERRHNQTARTTSAPRAWRPLGGLAFPTSFLLLPSRTPRLASQSLPFRSQQIKQQQHKHGRKQREHRFRCDGKRRGAIIFGRHKPRRRRSAWWHAAFASCAAVRLLVRIAHAPRHPAQHGQSCAFRPHN